MRDCQTYMTMEGIISYKAGYTTKISNKACGIELTVKEVFECGNIWKRHPIPKIGIKKIAESKKAKMILTSA